MKRVIIQSAEAVTSGSTSKAVMAIAEDYVYNNIEGSEQYINDEGLFCDQDGNQIDLMDGCDFGNHDGSAISVEVTY